MGCGNSITSKEYNHTIKIINKCLLENLINIKVYENLYILCNKNYSKDSIYSIIIDKKLQSNILKEIHMISSGENIHPIHVDYTEKYDLKSLLDLSIEREFLLINNLKILRQSLPTPSLKTAISSILIDENNIINKLIYIRTM